MYSNNISKISSRKGREGLRESIPACSVLSNLLCVSQHFLGDTPHNTQYTIHNTQYTIHNTQYTIHNTQYTIHNTQYTIHNTQ
ncbi:MAG: hypothetical protein LBR28_02525, partial [Bacteroidales bacterium]|nr:hypothetical protein [Bacteroidales bacterium]